MSEREQRQTEKADAPSTDCQTCGRSAKSCNDDRARGWSHCCLTCEERGSLVSHRWLHLVSTPPAQQPPTADGTDR